MASVQLGLGTLVKVDEDDTGSTFTTCTLITTCTPPARERELVDATALADTLSTYSAGIEKHSEFTFDQYWEPGDTQHESIDILFGAKTKVLWNVVYVDGTTDSFEGFVSKMAPNAIKMNEHLQRAVAIQRTGAITRT